LTTYRFKTDGDYVLTDTAIGAIVGEQIDIDQALLQGQADKILYYTNFGRLGYWGNYVEVKQADVLRQLDGGTGYGPGSGTFGTLNTTALVEAQAAADVLLVADKENFIMKDTDFGSLGVIGLLEPADVLNTGTGTAAGGTFDLLADRADQFAAGQADQLATDVALVAAQLGNMTTDVVNLLDADNDGTINMSLYTLTESIDYPEVGSVVEGDTVAGEDGTYHEPAVSEVKYGVHFGPLSAYIGEYVLTMIAGVFYWLIQHGKR